jgi:hypothetical protein
MPEHFSSPTLPKHKAMPLVGDFSLRNVCISYSMHSPGEFLSGDSMTADIYGYNEFLLGFSRLTHVRPIESRDQELWSRAPRRTTGLVLQLASFNMFHQQFHMVAAWSALHSYADAAVSGMHDGSTRGFAVVPILSPQVARAAEKRVRLLPWHGPAWEITVRAFHDARPADELAKAYARLFDTGMCFDQLHFGLGGLSPFSIVPQAVEHGNGWRRAVMRSSARSLPSPPLPSSTVPSGVLLVVRRGLTRVFVNEDEVYRALSEKTPEGRVRRVVMEEFTLSQQIHLVAAHTVVIGAHGQALVLGIFLPASDTQRAALIEVQPQNSGTNWRKIFSDMMSPRSIRYIQFRATLAGERLQTRSECGSESKARTTGCCSSVVPLMCNISVRANVLAHCARNAVLWTRNLSMAPPHRTWE